jgi:uncharacterized integral membrane protein
MKNKIIVAVAMLLLVVLFTLQNTEVVAVSILLWTLPISKALLMFILLAIGVLTGFFLGSYSRTRKRDGQGYPPTTSL